MEESLIIISLGIGAALTLPVLFVAKRIKPALWPYLFGISLVIAALIYVGFALAWGSTEWLYIEIFGVAVYAIFYWLAVRYSILWLSVGWLAHPLWDLLLHLFGPGSHITPVWYAIACVSFDLVVAAFILVQARHYTAAHN